MREATAWYRQQGGSELALRWVEAIQHALRHVSARPQTGATRYATELHIDGLRTWPVQGLPITATTPNTRM